MALAAIRGEQTLMKLSQQFDVHTNQIKQWKEAEIHLTKRPKLFRQTEPPLFVSSKYFKTDQLRGLLRSIDEDGN